MTIYQTLLSYDGLMVHTFRFVSFRSPYRFYLITVGVEVLYFHLITLRHTSQLVGSCGRGIGPSQRPLPDNTKAHKRQTCMPPVGFEPTIPASARPQTYALDRAATGIGGSHVLGVNLDQVITTRLKVLTINCIVPYSSVVH
jgi:hypothetical protein